jgi:hypothetical protein
MSAMRNRRERILRRIPRCTRRLLARHPSDSNVTVPRATSSGFPPVSFSTFQPMELCPTSNEKIRSRFPIASIPASRYKFLCLSGTKTKLNNAARPTVERYASDVISVLKKERTISLLFFFLPFLCRVCVSLPPGFKHWNKIYSANAVRAEFPSLIFARKRRQLRSSFHSPLSILSFSRHWKSIRVQALPASKNWN